VSLRVAAATAAAVAASLTAAAPQAGTGLAAHDVRLSEIEALDIAARTAATWCGTATQTDRHPNAVAGHPSKWIYALPSDGADALATYGTVMQTDAEAIDAWWRLQDPARTPRNDVAAFPCGTQLDIATLRLPQSGAQLTGPARFNAIATGLQAAGHASSFTKYVVYYDGPVADDQICGQGGSDRAGFGIAVVFVRACAGVSTAWVAVHELVHSLGAVPAGAPNECSGEEEGHVCDDALDLLYPYIDNSTLESRILDVGRNDYYGHGGSRTDVRRSPWLVHLDAQVPFALTLSGAGSVSSDVPGLDCAASCTTTWNAGTRLTLTARPRAGTKLVRWAGRCTGSGACTATVAPGATVSALFAPSTYRLSVRVTGRGMVRSGRAGIACRPRCASAFPSYMPVTLTATPENGWRFRSWSGACRGSRRTCALPMTAAAQARAVFVRARR
jgi:hypothetical protein